MRQGDSNWRRLKRIGILVLVLSLIAAGVGYWRHVAPRRQAIQMIRQAGGNVHSSVAPRSTAYFSKGLTEYSLPERGLRWLVGRGSFERHWLSHGNVRTIDLVSAKGFDGDLTWLPLFPELEALEVNVSQLTTAGCEQIGAHLNLWSLGLYGDGTVDSGLEAISSSSRIRSLTFWLSNITDVGLSHVATMSALEYLDLNQCHHLEGHPFYQRQWACAGTLRDLRIDCNELHFQAFFGLEQFENLEYLALNAHRLDSNLDAEFHGFPDDLLGWMPPPVFPELEYARLLQHGEWVPKFLHMQPKLKRVEGYDYSVHDNPERAAWPSREELYKRHLETNRQWHQTPSPRWPWKERIRQYGQSHSG